MYLRTAKQICTYPEKYNAQAVEEAEELLGGLMFKYLNFLVLLETIGLITVFTLKRLLVLVGGFIGMFGILIMLANISADTPLTFRQIVPIEIITLISLVGAYIGYELIEAERRGRHGKRKRS